jgi:hypothetical protein
MAVSFHASQPSGLAISNPDGQPVPETTENSSASSRPSPWQVQRFDVRRKRSRTPSGAKCRLPDIGLELRHILGHSGRCMRQIRTRSAIPSGPKARQTRRLARVQHRRGHRARRGRSPGEALRVVRKPTTVVIRARSWSGVPRAGNGIVHFISSETRRGHMWSRSPSMAGNPLIWSGRGVERGRWIFPRRTWKRPAGNSLCQSSDPRRRNSPPAS